MKVEIKQTRDGSNTLYRPDLDETYHSIHGAIQESMHVFIKNGMDYFIEKQQASSLNIYEMGFGSGLNALLSLELSKCQNISIKYYTSECYTLKFEVIDELKYFEMLDSDLKSDFIRMHQGTYNEWMQIDQRFELYIDTRDIIQSDIPTHQFDLIFFDAFAPNKQPELWTPAVFRKMYDALKQYGVLVTYCAKGQVKRDLKLVGFIVESIPGPPGKREMIRATKP